ncbi:MAG: hypothetical protein ACLQNE_09375 [Thermoguttaceae bacterium]|jgi:hypothetical protein
MVNEIDGYKAPTESQSSRPLPACWMVKEIARYGAGKCSQLPISFTIEQAGRGLLLVARKCS